MYWVLLFQWGLGLGFDRRSRKHISILVVKLCALLEYHLLDTLLQAWLLQLLLELLPEALVHAAALLQLERLELAYRFLARCLDG